MPNPVISLRVYSKLEKNNNSKTRAETARIALVKCHSFFSAKEKLPFSYSHLLINQNHSSDQSTNHNVWDSNIKFIADIRTHQINYNLLSVPIVCFLNL